MPLLGDLLKETKNKTFQAASFLGETLKPKKENMVSPTVATSIVLNKIADNAQNAVSTVSSVVTLASILDNRVASPLSKANQTMEPILNTINISTNVIKTVTPEGQGINLKTLGATIGNYSLKGLSDYLATQNLILKPVPSKEDQQIKGETEFGIIVEKMMSKAKFGGGEVTSNIKEEKKKFLFNKLFKAFTNEPFRTNWFIVEIEDFPLGWKDKNRAVYNNVIKPYLTNLFDGNKDLIDEFLSISISDFLMYKIRGISNSETKVETITIPYFNLNFGYPGTDSSGITSNVFEYIKETPLLSEIRRGTHDLFSLFTMEDFVELWKQSVVDKNGIAYYPYDYLIPKITVYELAPGIIEEPSIQFKNPNFVKVYKWVYERCFFLSKTRKDFNYKGASEPQIEQITFGCMRKYRDYAGCLTANIQFNHIYNITR